MRFRELSNPTGTGTIRVSEARLAIPAVAEHYGVALDEVSPEPSESEVAYAAETDGKDVSEMAAADLGQASPEPAPKPSRRRN